VADTTYEPREWYLSELLGKKIYDPEGRTVGRVRDLVARWVQAYPEVTALKHARSTEIIPLAAVSRLGPYGAVLRECKEGLRTRPVADQEIFVRRWLLDKQIVDLRGVKVVRVNDIKLRLVRSNGHLEVLVAAVDVGPRGLLRRLGLGRLSRVFAEQLLDWQHFKPLETRTAALQLVVPKEELARLHPADLADLLEGLRAGERALLLRQLDRERAAETLAEVEPKTRAQLLEAMASSEASAIVGAMAPDEAADALSDLAREKSAEILRLMPPGQAREVESLMAYPEGTAGALMTPEFVALPASLTAQEVIERLRELAPSAETIYYVYVVDDAGRLVGVLSLRELIVAPPDTPVTDIMRRRVVALRVTDGFEQVLEATAKYDLLAVPVVDPDGKLVGIVTVDDVLDTLLTGRQSRKYLEKFSRLLILRALKRR
jgi:CBS domain-containing protein